MANEKQFVDPLEDIDPVMEDAFSSFEEPNNFSEGAAAVSKAPVADSQPVKKMAVSHVEFPDLDDANEGKKLEKGVFSNIPVQVSVELGRSTISLKEIYDLSEGSIIELDRLVGEPLDLVVNGQIIAQGEVVAIDNNFGLRIKTIVASPTL
ncbi:MAG: flagellar motor switch protein FliN [Rickettsiales bacterium]|nr:flagellar motor switch protein FliN [Rickettsiales bacterium]|tara:strand:+ start:350 stop:802 length:453 start_codon:yes stop_codon:yes gene_type:complete